MILCRDWSTSSKTPKSIRGFSQLSYSINLTKTHILFSEELSYQILTFWNSSFFYSPTRINKPSSNPQKSRMKSLKSTKIRKRPLSILLDSSISMMIRKSQRQSFSVTLIIALLVCSLRLRRKSRMKSLCLTSKTGPSQIRKFSCKMSSKSLNNMQKPAPISGCKGISSDG